MKSGVTSIDGVSVNIAAKVAIGGVALEIAGFALEIAVILCVSVATGLGYHLWAYNTVGPVEFFFGVGGLAALIYMLPYLLAEQYRIGDFLEGRRNAGRGFLVWNYTFLCLSVIAFLTKTTEEFSRGWLLLFYACGMLTVIAYEGVFRRILRWLMLAERIAVRRLMLVGAADEILRFANDAGLRRAGVRVVATAALPRVDRALPGEAGVPDALEEVLAAAVTKARALRADDIVVLTDWSRTDLISHIVDKFTALPVAIHLGASSLIGRFTEARVSRFATLTALSLTAAPLGPLQTLAKRAVDLVAAAVALALLSPLFAAVALAIKLDSRGPVLFRQRRNGRNQQVFRIWKFRTMSALDDGDLIIQARPDDDRVTRAGRFLRRYSIDELPQLINVLKGEMSLVGPRPHAVAHDKEFERSVASYSRRLNVLPGITGWAQVNGLRGPTATAASISRRVEFDLYYVDNWSLTFDLYILILTLLSPKVYLNAH